MIMCHMIADTRDELLAMADRIGVNPKWIQDKGSFNEHFDICLQKKTMALKFGAKEVGFRELAKIIQNRTYEGEKCPY